MSNRLTYLLTALRNRGANIALLTLTALMAILAPKPAAAQTTPTFGTATVPDTTYTVNVAVSDTLPVASAGALTYTLTPALPAGLTYKAATLGNGGIIAGVPTTAASATTYTLMATDANNATATLTFTLAVALSSDATLSRLTFYSVEQAASGTGGQSGGAGGQAGSSDANLRDIQIGDFTIPVPRTFTVEAKVTLLTVKPIPNDTTATYTIDPSDDSDDMDGHQVALVPGSNTITIKVTAANELNKKTYTIIVTRKMPIDYDDDSDGLIDVRTLAQLNAIRYDLEDGDGEADNPADANAYAVAFPDIGPTMGCPARCTGYELRAYLDFDKDNDGLITADDSTAFFAISATDSSGFVPIGLRKTQEFKATFRGNGYTISNLVINRSTKDYVGLFYSVVPRYIEGVGGRIESVGGRIEGVGLINAKVTGKDRVGALVGTNLGTVVNCFVTGAVSGNSRVGGLVGHNYDNVPITASYSTASVTGTSYVGALVGSNSGTIQASYAIGKVSGSSQGLVGYLTPSKGRIWHSYYDSSTTRVSGTSAIAKTTAQLQAPISYFSTLGNDTTAIYSAWNVNVDSTSTSRNNTPDDPWNFGESNQYPILKLGNDTTAAVQFAAQPDKAPTFGTATIRDTTYSSAMAVSDTLPAATATSGNGKLTYALTPDLPAGLTFNTMTRVIAGTPTTAASASTYTLTVGDSDSITATSDTDSLTFTIAVAVVVTIADDSLRAVILDSLGKSAGDTTITNVEMLRLTRLDAPDKGISDLTGLEFATGLDTLDLGHNHGRHDPRRFFNSNNITDIRALSGLTRLKVLSLERNAISNISPLRNLTSLKLLDIRGNRISNISVLRHLTGLTGLWFAYNSISDISSLSHLTDLTVLYLRNAGITNISPLRDLTKLTNLNLYGNRISDLSPLSGLTKLTNLNLYGNRISDLSPLSGLTKLTTLNLTGNGLTDISGLRGLTSLTNLSLVGNNISDLSDLSHLTSLTALNLWSNRVSDSGLSHLSGLTKLTYLNLGGYSNKISDISHLSRLTKLTTLSLAWNSIINLSSLSGLDSLKTLHLDHNRISNLSPLVSNTGLGRGDYVDVRSNPLSALSRGTHIPTLTDTSRGVTVAFDSLSVARLVKVSGDGQIGTASTALAHPFVVKVQSANDTTYAYGHLPVTFSVAAGGGSLSATSDTTDVNGLAQTRLTSGTTVRTDTVKVFVEGASDTLIFFTVPIRSVTIPDDSLRAVILTSLGKSAGDTTITNAELLRLTRLEAANKGIRNVTGLEFAKNLDTLNLGHKGTSRANSNAITDITPLAGLVKLKKLRLSFNDITDISPLRDLTNLRALRLGGNRITDISVLSNLANLETLLILNNNAVTDITPLRALTNLTYLNLLGNDVSDISVLSGLTNLTRLVLGGNRISDISVLSGLDSLGTLGLGGNRIENISSLSSLSNLTGLNLGENRISDLKPLVDNTELGSGSSVGVQGNPLSAASRTSYIPALTDRGVAVGFDDLSMARLVKVSGDGQTGTARADLAKPFVVKMRSAIYTSYTYKHLPVTFSVTAGGGSLSTTSDTTDANGLARTLLTLGATVGTDTVKAFVEGASDTLIFTTLSPRAVTIADANLRAVIEDSLDKSAGDTTITNADMLRLTRLIAPNKGISNLTGLEFATQLDTLDLGNNRITAIDSLAGLTRLKKLSLGGNRIADIDSLARLTDLTWLWLSYNAIADIDSLANLTDLTWLGLGDNRIANLSPLVNLTHLTRLGLSNNRISDLEPLVRNTGLGSGDHVDVRGNPLSAASRTTYIPTLRGNSVTVTFDSLTSLRLVKVSGDGQIGTVSTALANPFVVKVQDQNGRGYAGLPVAFSVTAGGGSLSASTDTTDATGQAETILTLGATAHTHMVSVSAEGLSQTLTFTATLPTPDFDGNGRVNFADFLALANKMGSSRDRGSYEVKYDLDGDGEIGMSDFRILTARFGDGKFDDAK